MVVNEVAPVGSETARATVRGPLPPTAIIPLPPTVKTPPPETPPGVGEDRRS